MTTAVAVKQPAERQPTCPPPLESGMRLTSKEFERRYEMFPDLRAELIEGVVYVSSPVRIENHGEPTFMVNGWLAAYVAQHGVARAADNATTRLDNDNNVQPDAMLWRSGGSARVSDDDYLEGAPELVVEVAASSASIDLGPKLEAYRRNGVQEYVVWQIYENRLDWFVLTDGRYVALQPDRRGVIESRAFPGLRLAVAKLLARDLRGVLAEQNRKPRARA